VLHAQTILILPVVGVLLIMAVLVVQTSIVITPAYKQTSISYMR